MQTHNIHSNITLVLLFFSFWALAQKEKMLLRKGNEAFTNSRPFEAANYYKKSLQEKNDYYKASFNLGNAYYKTAELIKNGKLPSPDKSMTADSASNILYNQAAEQFEIVAKSVSNADTIQQAWHNYGNSKLMQKNYEDAIYGFKKSLRLNPHDEDTRYNLAYAQKKLAEQQKNQQNKDNKQNQDQQKKQEQDQKNQQEKKDQENQQQKDQQPQMSKEQAEKMLNALKNDEKKLQALRKKKGEPGQKVKIEKDW